MTIYSSLNSASSVSGIIGPANGGTGVANPTANSIPVAEGSSNFQFIGPPSQTGWVEWFAGVPQASTASNRYRFYDDMDDVIIYDNHVSGTAAAVSASVPIDTTHAGLIELQTGTDANGKASFGRGPSANAFTLGGGNVYWESAVNIQNLAVNGGDDYRLIVGIHDGWIFTGPPPNNGLWFEYFVDTSANWIINTANGGVATNTTTTTAITTGWVRLGIKYTLSGTTATFYINGTSVGTIATNIPTNPISAQWAVFKTNGTTNRIFYVDYVDLMINFTTPR